MTVQSASLQELKAWKAFVGGYREEQARRAGDAAETTSLSLLISAMAIQYIESLSSFAYARSLYRKCSSALVQLPQFPLPEPGGEHEAELQRLLLVLQTQFSSLLNDPLIFGYTYQYWCAPDRKTAQANIQSANKSIDTSALSAFTQIYTPVWVVDYILANTMLSAIESSSNVVSPAVEISSPWLLPSSKCDRAPDYDHVPKSKNVAKLINDSRSVSSITVLDPACGAGNFLVRAFDQLMEPQVRSGISQDDAAANILEHQLAGTDIDPLGLAVLTYALIARCEKLGVKNVPRLAGIALALPDPANDSVGSKASRNAASQNSASLGSLARDWKAPHPLAKQYDAVVTNPPYIGRKLISRDLKDLLKKNFPDANQDLSTAFLRRSLEFLAPAGRLGLITQASMMFLPSHGKLRKHILDEFNIVSVVDAGPGVFPLQGGEKVNSGIFIIEKPFGKEPEAGGRERLTPPSEEPYTASCFIDLRNATDKENTLLDLIRSQRNGGAVKSENASRGSSRSRIVSGGSDGQGSRVRLIPPAVFYRFHKCAFNYHIPNCVSRILDESPVLEEIADIRQGLATSDNNRFVKMLWEVTHDERTSGAWVPYVKGAGGERWYSPVRHAVNWDSDGKLIKDAVSRRYPYLNGNIAWVVKNEQFYFRKGLCFSFVNTKGMAVRLLPPGCIFDVGASAVFSRAISPDNQPGASQSCTDDGFLLGYLNSSFIVALAASLNPTINYQVGDLKRLPHIRFEDLVKERIAELALKCAAYKRTLSLLTDPSSWFDWTAGGLELGDCVAHPIESQCPEALLSVQFKDFEKTVAEILNALVEVETAVDTLVLDSVARTYRLNSTEIYDIARWTREFATSERQDVKLKLDNVFVDVVLSKRALALQRHGFGFKSDRGFSKVQNPEDRLWLSEKLKRDSCEYFEKTFPERLTKLFYGRLPVSIT